MTAETFRARALRLINAIGRLESAAVGFAGNQGTHNRNVLAEAALDFAAAAKTLAGRKRDK